MAEAAGEVTVARLPDASVIVRLAGRWRMGGGLPAAAGVDLAIDGPPVAGRVAFDASGLTSWDSSLLVLTERILERCRRRGVAADTTGLPDGLRRLIALSQAAAGQRPPPRPAPLPLVARIGERGIETVSSLLRLLRFLGELAFSAARLVTARARVRKRDVVAEIQAAGAGSLAIVAVVSFLLGMILAFVGDVTLRPFGATLYVANVVTVAMVRELGPVMTAIVMAGRTGSAYAAQLGTMKVTQEIDALTTMALPPSEFLVLPRVLALSLMMPFLVVYGDFIALAGGGLVASASGEGLGEYARQAKGSIALTTFWVGLVKSAVFGIVVAVCGCIQGLRANKSAAAVGEAATRAVVTSIVWIIAIDGLFAVVLYELGV
jgi:phospholipid/cholesterol/gamma-HCH transport system permease protein